MVFCDSALSLTVDLHCRMLVSEPLRLWGMGILSLILKMIFSAFSRFIAERGSFWHQSVEVLNTL